MQLVISENECRADGTYLLSGVGISQLSMVSSEAVVQGDMP